MDSMIRRRLRLARGQDREPEMERACCVWPFICGFYGFVPLAQKKTAQQSENKAPLSMRCPTGQLISDNRERIEFNVRASLS
jgi:hypothetical protein